MHTCRRIPARRLGFSLAEVLVASTIVTVVVMAIGALASAVQEGADYNHATTTVHQHGRVVVERIQAAIRGAASSSTEPPLVVLSSTHSTYSFPDTLVAWKVDANNDDAPQANELVVYCPNPSNARELWEVTDPMNTAPATLTDAAALGARVNAMKASATTVRSVLTALVRPVSAADVGQTRSAVRFNLELRPTAAEWAQYKANTRAWNQLSWAQGVYGVTSGLRQARVSFEIQLVPQGLEGPNDDVQAIPFLGSGAAYYELTQ